MIASRLRTLNLPVIYSVCVWGYMYGDSSVLILGFITFLVLVCYSNQPTNLRMPSFR